MGLDMYMHKRTYIGNQYKEAKDQIKIKVKGVKQERVVEIVETVGYWRKANAIHEWFVQNVQDGADDCKEYVVNFDQLSELLELVNKVLASSELVEGKIQNGYHFDDKGKQVFNMVDGKYIKDPSVAKELLPTTEGFFFGGTEYDEYYYESLVETKKILEDIIKEGNGCDYYYQSSW